LTGNKRETLKQMVKSNAPQLVCLSDHHMTDISAAYVPTCIQITNYKYVN